MTHKEQAQRRKAIAEFVKSGKSLSEAVIEFNVTLYTVYKSCREMGAPTKCKVRVGDRSFLIIADLINTDLNCVEIGRNRGVTSQCVQQMYAKCVNSGIPVRERKMGRPPTPSSYTKE